jgi:hypothetical protein
MMTSSPAERLYEAIPSHALILARLSLPLMDLPLYLYSLGVRRLLQYSQCLASPLVVIVPIVVPLIPVPLKSLEKVLSWVSTHIINYIPSLSELHRLFTGFPVNIPLFIIVPQKLLMAPGLLMVPSLAIVPLLSTFNVPELSMVP